MVWWPLAALAGVCAPVAVVCKADTALPLLPEGVERWEEPAEPRHPLAGIVHALERARGPLLVCAGDMPFVTAEACASLAGAAEAGCPAAVVGRAAGRIEPLLGVYRPAALDVLRVAPANSPLREAVARLRPALVELPPAAVRSVNTRSELAAAETELAGSDPGRFV